MSCVYLIVATRGEYSSYSVMVVAYRTTREEAEVLTERLRTEAATLKEWQRAYDIEHPYPEDLGFDFIKVRQPWWDAKAEALAARTRDFLYRPRQVGYEDSPEFEVHECTDNDGVFTEETSSL